MKTQLTKEELLKAVENRITKLKEEERFVKKFQEDSFLAMKWSQEIFKVVAELNLLLGVKEALKGEATVESLRKWFLENILSNSSAPSFSTSPCSNLLSQYELEVKSTFYQDYLDQV